MKVCFVIHEILHAQPELNGADNSPLNVTGQLSRKLTQVLAHTSNRKSFYFYMHAVLSKLLDGVYKAINYVTMPD